MNYFLNNHKSQKPMPDEKLMALALQTEEKPNSPRNEEEMKRCVCCPANLHKNAERSNLENVIHIDFDVCLHWYHSTPILLDYRNSFLLIRMNALLLLKGFKGAL